MDLWEGCREGRRCPRDTYQESNTTKYTSIRGLRPGEDSGRGSRNTSLRLLNFPSLARQRLNCFFLAGQRLNCFSLTPQRLNCSSLTRQRVRSMIPFNLADCHVQPSRLPGRLPSQPSRLPCALIRRLIWLLLRDLTLHCWPSICSKSTS